MPHLFRGHWIDDQSLTDYLKKLPHQIQTDIASGVLEAFSPELVLKAVEKLSKSPQLAMFLSETPDYVLAASKDYLSPSALACKLKREMGENFGKWQVVCQDDDVSKVIEERQQALGVLLHIGAGNAIALSAISVLEGLLCGNINILKLPAYEGGLSLALLHALVEVEPKLAPYLYAFDLRATDTASIKMLSDIANGAVVWGSDEAINGLRQLAPTTLTLIEWGHRISFAYVTEVADLDVAMGRLAQEIWATNQMFCNSPQCLFVETQDKALFNSCGQLLFEKMKALKVNSLTDSKNNKEIDFHRQAEITWIRSLVKTQSSLESSPYKQWILEDENLDFSVLMQDEAVLKASPLYRNIWVMPMDHQRILEVLRPHKGHLQTVGLACGEEEYNSLSNLFSGAGVNRIRPMGDMMGTYIGEPHDGKVTLVQYTRRVSRVREINNKV